jgi:hypothetical protein
MLREVGAGEGQPAHKGYAGMRGTETLRCQHLVICPILIRMLEVARISPAYRLRKRSRAGTTFAQLDKDAQLQSTNPTRAAQPAARSGAPPNHGKPSTTTPGGSAPVSPFFHAQRASTTPQSTRWRVRADTTRLQLRLSGPFFISQCA